MSGRKTEFYIPPNYKTGISLFGKSFQVVSLVEGIILALLPLGIYFFVLPVLDIHVSFDKAATVITFSSALLGYLGIKGINGYSISQFVRSMMRYRKNKRICYYNPRIKTEASPYSINNSAEQMLPREKLEEFYKKARKNYDEKQREQAIEEQKHVLTERENLFFSDDVGVLDTPVEYMTGKEYREYKKKLKKEERQRKKEDKLKQS